MVAIPGRDDLHGFNNLQEKDFITFKINFMPNKDGTGNALDGIKRIGIAALCFAPLVFIGTRLEPKWWAMVLTGLIGGAALAKFATKGSWVNIIGWGAIGAIAGFGETTSNNLYITPLFYGTLDASRSGSLIYGKFDSTTANQKLQVNGQLDVRYGASVTGSVKLTEALNIKPLYYGTGSIYANNFQNVSGTTGDIRIFYDDNGIYNLAFFAVSGSNSWFGLP